ncbi:MAG TPA: carbamoyl-phosphate synthase large subunit [Candidatus Avimonas sp.]|nr:carbamoyl-phosphate synthase large subunit [Clostridiales bacterium]HOB36453.1 carbamoyl-phosphate synthase large subunit [Candidatus Avimonas sp.]HQA15746.1 carbamoyl-phosphate synthase large subunit [Candidatus Avimonas sp.]HQD38036.1 carbamoyl-phosphate synthase large subunit [Candidatus Avimonas sp.]
MPLNKNIKRILVIGSGPIVIGQAAEFDYAGTQACRALKEVGLEVILVNSNPATIMTDKAMADKIYIEPLTLDTLKRIIELEKPDSILSTLGGQTGLTLSMQLAKEGFLERHNVRLLGASPDTIDKAEDRQLFKDAMMEIGEPVIPSTVVNDVRSAVDFASEIGYPVIIRPAFTLGGTGGGIAHSETELREIAAGGLRLSPINQVLVEKCIAGWKEIEFEVIRDSAGNAVTVCSMENVDPVGVHTGDSIVVAPAMTLSSAEYAMLRSAALNIISALKIEGGCNCQFALKPDSFEYAVIEVNPRVSRSSALASKATGYPIAKVAAKIAIGYTLDEIQNAVTGKTTAFFEPAIDYVVVKFPKWPFDKFVYAKRTLGSQMKATGEVMAIGTSFEQAVMKAVRGAEISLDSLNMPELAELDDNEIRGRLHNCDDQRLFVIFEALKRGISCEEIRDITKIDIWFLHKLNNLAKIEKELAKGFDNELYLKAKKLGYPDWVIERISGQKIKKPVSAAFKMVDTCAAEFPAETPYFYSTFDDENEAEEFKEHRADGKKTVIVFGSGPIRIGQGIEFDYASVHCVWALKRAGFDVVIVNNNPETVSTDFDTADRLYFEPLTPEDVMHIINTEKPYGVVVAFGGQTAIKLAKFLEAQGVRILGTPADSIDAAEDRERFDNLLEQHNITRPKGATVMTTDEALKAAGVLGYPVLMRPSYVLGGQNMIIAFCDEDIIEYMNIILSHNIENPVLIDKYLMGIEIEIDAICDGEDILIPGIMEHIERAGVHSGDSIAVYPAWNVTGPQIQLLTEYTKKLAVSLKTQGLINIQYVIHENKIYVIEVNPRSSRTIPYISKVTGVPMVELATRAMLGEKLRDMGYGTGLYRTPPYVAVKVPVFSFEKLVDVDTHLGPEMKSTGEVLGIGKSLDEALYKGLVAAGYNMTKRGGVLITVRDIDKFEIVDTAKRFVELGFKLYATKGSAEVIRKAGIEVETVNKIHESDDNVITLLESGKVSYIISTSSKGRIPTRDSVRIRRKAVELAIPCLTSIDTANALANSLRSRYSQYSTELVDINNMRSDHVKLKFTKMHGCGNDYLYFNCFEQEIISPESLSVSLSDRHFGIGGDGVVLILPSDVADAKMRMFNLDGSEGKMCGNAIRCVAKYLYDNGIVKKDEMSIETLSGIKKLKLYFQNGKVNSATVDMGPAVLEPSKIPVNLDGDRVISRPVRIDGGEYKITCVSIGNPHCVVFVDNLDNLDIQKIGPMFEYNPLFPERVNVEFITVLNRATLKMRVWERGSGETWSCGTGACAAAVAAVLNGYCPMNEDITVRLKGGNLVIRYTGDTVYMTGNAVKIYDGEVEV